MPLMYLKHLLLSILLQFSLSCCGIYLHISHTIISSRHQDEEYYGIVKTLYHST